MTTFYTYLQPTPSQARLLRTPRRSSVGGVRSRPLALPLRQRRQARPISGGRGGVDWRARRRSWRGPSLPDDSQQSRGAFAAEVLSILKPAAPSPELDQVEELIRVLEDAGEPVSTGSRDGDGDGDGDGKIKGRLSLGRRSLDRLGFSDSYRTPLAVACGRKLNDIKVPNASRPTQSRRPPSARPGGGAVAQEPPMCADLCGSCQLLSRSSLSRPGGFQSSCWCAGCNPTPEGSIPATPHPILSAT